MLRKIVPVVLLSVLCSALTAYLLVSKMTDERKKGDQQYAQLINQEELVLSGNLRKYFNSSTPNNFIDAARTGRTSVVGINSLNNKGEVDSDLYSKSSGSGVIISQNGFIVTNHHVVENASDLLVVLDDNREYKGKIIGTDPATDLALIKIEATDLVPLVYGNSDSLQVGEWVLAIGNPFKLQATVTAGIVSAKARDINILQRQGIESFIQTDAAVNPGNSGGALINTNGELVGINAAIISKSGNYEGFSFAIPVNLVQKVIYDIREFGAVQRGWMGISIFDVDDQMAKRMGLSEVSGIYVNVVDRQGAAHAAGLRNGDIITTVNEKKTNRTPIFMEEIGKHRPGDQISIEYVRDGKVLRTAVVLRNQLNTYDLVAVRKDPILLELGFEVRDLDSNEKNIMPKQGVYVVSIYRGKAISETNMEAGYIITKVNGDVIETAEQLVKKLNKTTGSVILEGYYENYVGSFPYTFNIP